MTECNAIIEANNEINKLKRENKKLNALCVEYGFEMGRLEEENEQLKKQREELFILERDTKNEWRTLKKENEELKFQNSNLMKEVAEYSRNAKELKKENEQLRQPNCRNCIHFSCDNADIYCMEKEYESIPDCSIAKDCDEYDGVYE